MVANVSELFKAVDDIELRLHGCLTRTGEWTRGGSPHRVRRQTNNFWRCAGKLRPMPCVNPLYPGIFISNFYGAHFRGSITE